jgi:hypothetical protein
VVKVLKSLRLRWYGHMARRNNERIPKHIVTTRMEGIRKTGNSQKRWTDEVTVARDGKERRRILLEANVNDGL